MHQGPTNQQPEESATHRPEDRAFTVHLQQRIAARDSHTEDLLVTQNRLFAPLPPPHFHNYPPSAPYRPAFPLPHERDGVAAQNAHLRWITTTIFTLAGATAALAQAILEHSESAHRRTRYPARAPGEAQPRALVSEDHNATIENTEVPSTRSTHRETITTDDFQGEGDDEAQAVPKLAAPTESEGSEGALLLETCAEHLRHVARTTQQIMSMLGTNLDTTMDTNMPGEKQPTSEEEC